MYASDFWQRWERTPVEGGTLFERRFWSQWNEGETSDLSWSPTSDAKISSKWVTDWKVNPTLYHFHTHTWKSSGSRAHGLIGLTPKSPSVKENVIIRTSSKLKTGAVYWVVGDQMKIEGNICQQLRTHIQDTERIQNKTVKKKKSNYKWMMRYVPRGCGEW